MPAEFSQNLRDIEFVNNVTMVLQQEPGILYPLAGMTMSGEGSTEVKIEDRFGQMTLGRKTERNGDTNYVDVQNTRRFAKKPGSYDVATLIDRNDVKSTSVDPKSPLVMAAAMATKKYHDDQFLVGWWGNAWEGVSSATTAVPFTSGNKIAVDLEVSGTNTGLTLAKLKELKRQLQKSNVNFRQEQPIILLDPDAEVDLFGITEYVNYFYNDKKPLVDGELKPFMGFRFLTANLGDAVAYPEAAALFKPSSVNRLPVIVPSGIARVVWTEFFGRVEPNMNKKYSEQIYAEAEATVVRTDEKKAWYIETRPLS